MSSVYLGCTVTGFRRGSVIATLLAGFRSFEAGSAPGEDARYLSRDFYSDVPDLYSLLSLFGCYSICSTLSSLNL